MVDEAQGLVRPPGVWRLAPAGLLRPFGVQQRLTIAGFAACLLMLLALSAAAPGLAEAADRREPPAARGGVLDLREWDFRESGPVKLQGEWAFYWQKLLTGDDFTGLAGAGDAVLAGIPHVWTDVRLDGKALPGDGYATYRLRVLLPEGQNDDLALRVPYLSTSCRIFIGNREAASCGEVSDSRDTARAGYRPQVVRIGPAGPEVELIVQISNYLYDRGGMWYALDLGTAEQAALLRENVLAMDLFLMGVFFFMGFYHLCIYMLRPGSTAALWFAIGCLIGGTRLLVIDEIVLLNWFPGTPVRLLVMVGYLTYYGGIAVITRYLYELYPDEISPRVVRGVTWISIAFMLTVFAPVSFFTSLIGYSHLLLVALMAYLLYGVCVALYRRRDGARLQFIGIVVFFLAILHDIVFNLHYISVWFYKVDVIRYLKMQIMALGLFVLVFIQAIVLARRFAHAYREVERMSEKLVNLNRMKDEFLFNTSHELKTPLHGIINLTQSMLEGAAGKLSKKQHAQLSSVVSVSRRLSNLINDILDFYKLKHGEIRLDRRRVSLQAALQANHEIFQHVIADRPVRLTVKLPDDLPLVYVDENRLLQILYNLIGNAIKFTERGEVTVAAARKGDLVEVAISDTGAGIPEDKLERIFHSFEEMGSSVSREYGGTGLGLSITKRLVELSGGELSVASEPGEGSTFRFTLPVSGGQELEPAGQRQEGDGGQPGRWGNAGAGQDRQAGRRYEERQGGQEERAEQAGREWKERRGGPGEEEAPLLARIDPSRTAHGRQPYAANALPAAASLSALHAPGAAKPYTILAVDDDPTNLQVIMQVFAQEPCRVLLAHDGAEALQLAEARRDIDLLVLDVMMPGMSGYEVCRALRERFTLFELPVLLVTVKNEPEDLLNGFAAGANDFLVKPFYSHELRGRVRTLLELKRSVESMIRSEMAFLQAQIKPHFLFNALNTIVSVCPRDPRKAVELLTELGDFLRGSFDFENQAKQVSLDKELQLTESYLIIEQARFADRLRVEMDIEEGLDGRVQLPPLTIQPLVENAVRHGIMNKEQGGTVRLRIRTGDDGVWISVEDDGIGMSGDKVRALLNPDGGDVWKEGQGGGVGLRNIELRLRRMYGRGLDMDSEPGKGTRVAFTVPDSED